MPHVGGKTIDVLFSPEEIASRNLALAQEIAKRDFHNLLTISILKGSFIFAADLIRAMHDAGVEPDGLLCEIAARLAAGGAFPHEIGLFLGYPLADVQGYIQHCGQHAHCTGLWKVYGDAQEAQRRFQVYRHCRKAVLANYQRGMTLSRLAVSA